MEQQVPDHAAPLSTRLADESLRYPGVGTLILIWAFIGAATSVRGFLSYSHAFRTDFVFWIAYIACYLPWGFLTALTFRLEDRLPLGTNRWHRNLVTLAFASVPISAVAAPLMRIFFAGTLRLLGEPSSFHRTWGHLLYELFIGEFFFWLSVAASYSLRTLFNLQRAKERAMQLSLEKSLLEADLNQAQLDVLRAKLNPHFLFNSLQNISVLTRQDPVTASRMLVKLGDLLRAVLRTDSQAECTLEDEIALLQHYMALEQMRFGDRLDFEVEVERQAKQGLVPSFILQPLVENAIVHGLQDLRQDGVIRVHASVLGENLVMRVTDNGTGLQQSKKNSKSGGLGLSSTRERLARMYPGRHAFTINDAVLKGTEVRIEIPFQTEPAEDRLQEQRDAPSNR